MFSHPKKGDEVSRKRGLTKRTPGFKVTKVTLPNVDALRFTGAKPAIITGHIFFVDEFDSKMIHIQKVEYKEAMKYGATPTLYDTNALSKPNKNANKFTEFMEFRFKSLPATKKLYKTACQL